MGVSDPAERRGVLVGAKLSGLVKEHARAEPSMTAGFGGGAAALVGDAAWILLDDQGDPNAVRLGPALAWALRHGAASVTVLAGQGTGTLQRRADAFDLPISVFHVDGHALLPAVGEPIATPAAAREDHRAFASVITEGGADVVEEHGIVVGEVRGLEVCRVVDDLNTGEAKLEVGVGAHDRETFQMLNAERPIVEALAGVVEIVGRHRAVDALQHPLNHLAASRGFRARLIDSPALLGATEVVAAQPPVARTNVKDQVPCVALATIDGETVTVVCTTGIDLDVVPFAADAVRMHGTARALIAAPKRDIVDIQRRLAEHVRVPTAFVPIPAVDAATST